MHSMNLIATLMWNYNFPMGSDNFSKGKILFLPTEIIILDIRSTNGTRKFIPCFLMFPEAIFIAVVGLWRTYTKAPLNWHSQIEALKICTYKMHAFPELVAALFNRPLKAHLESLSLAHVHYRYLKLVDPA